MNASMAREMRLSVFFQKLNILGVYFRDLIKQQEILPHFFLLSEL